MFTITNIDNEEKIHIDPRTKLVLIICMSSMAVMLNNVLVLLGLFLTSLILLRLFNVNFRNMLSRMKTLLVIMLFIALMQSVFGGGGKSLVNIGSLNIITSGGILLASEFLLRMLIIFATAGILATCGSREIIQGLVQMRLPYEIAFMAVLGLKFLPIFREEFNDAKTAIQLRGINIKSLKFKQKLRIYASLLQPVVAGALIRSRGLSMSIEMRGFRSCPKRTSYRFLIFNKYDYIILLSSVVLTTGIFIGYYTIFATI